MWPCNLWHRWKFVVNGAPCFRFNRYLTTQGWKQVTCRLAIHFLLLFNTKFHIYLQFYTEWFLESVSTWTCIYLYDIRYKRLFNSIDLTKDFFYSYTYRTMWCLQRNVKTSYLEGVPNDDMFVWNEFLTRETRSQLQNSIWTVALIHGFFRQVNKSIFKSSFALL